MIEYDEHITEEILDYYRDFYRNLGLADLEQYARIKLKEDEWELERIKKMEEDLSISLKDYPRHLIVGLGTGGLAVALMELGVKTIRGIDPFPPALEIACKKAELLGLPEDAFQRSRAEHLPYEDGAFDFIHCFSVLEHVQDTRQSIREMYRVLGKRGILYIHTPNYAWPYEGHYKLPAPVFLPGGKILTNWMLRVMGRPIQFFKTIQLHSERRLNRLLKDEVHLYYRIYSRGSALRHIPTGNSFKAKLVRLVYRFFDRCLDIYPYQEIIVKKSC